MLKVFDMYLLTVIYARTQNFPVPTNLRIHVLASYKAKTAKISNFWTSWSIIQLTSINHLFKI